MPIANVNRIVFLNLHSVCQFLLTRQPIADWSLFAVNLVQYDFSWLAGRKPIQFRQFTTAQVLHHLSTYPTRCFLIVIGLQNTAALSVILFQLVMSCPNRNLPNLYELWKNICQSTIGWRVRRNWHTKC